MDIMKWNWWLGSSEAPFVPQPEYENLISAWDFDNDIFDYAGGENHGFLNNASFASGKFGTGVAFTGTNSYVSVNDSNNLSFGNGSTDQPFSFEMWINPTNLSAQRWIVSKRGNTTNLEYVIVINQTTGTITFACYTSSTAFIAVTSNTGFSAGSLQHLTCTYSGSKTFGGLKIYKNGVALAVTNASSGVYTGMTAGNNVLAIGQQSWALTGSSGFVGTIDEVHLHSVELSQATITAIYNGGSGLQYIYNPSTAVAITDTLTVLAVNGNYRFATDGTNLKYSSNNGTSYFDNNWGVQWSGGLPVYNKAVDMALIFSDGSLIFSCSNKIFKSTDGLQTITEITTTLSDGTTPYPIHSPVDATRPGNYYQVYNNECKLDTIGGNEIFVWVNYCNVPDQVMGAAPVTVWRALNVSGNITVKSLYRFGQNTNYRDNGTAAGGNTGTLLGDSGNPLVCRHGHSVCKDPDSLDYYLTTGDSDTEVHWLKLAYNSGTDTATATTLFSGLEATKWKAVSLNIISGVVYFGSDATNSPAATERGIFSCTFANIGVSATRIIDPGTVECTSILINTSNNKIVATFLGSRATQVLLADNLGASNVQYVTIKNASTTELILRQNPVNNGYWKMCVGGGFWFPPVKTVFVKAT